MLETLLYWNRCCWTVELCMFPLVVLSIIVWTAPEYQGRNGPAPKTRRPPPPQGSKPPLVPPPPPPSPYWYKTSEEYKEAMKEYRLMYVGKPRIVERPTSSVEVG